jgi:hypothetical protein
VRDSIKVDEEGSSGANVTSLIGKRSVPYTFAGSVDGFWKRLALWAPFFDGWRKGPSAWTPRSEAALVNVLGLRDGSTCVGYQFLNGVCP